MTFAISPATWAWWSFRCLDEIGWDAIAVGRSSANWRGWPTQRYGDFRPCVRYLRRRLLFVRRARALQGHAPRKRPECRSEGGLDYFAREAALDHGRCCA